VVKAFRENGGTGKPMYLKAELSFDQTESKALKGAYDQWRTNIIDTSLLGNMSKVEQFDAVGERVQPEEMHRHVLISSDVNKYKVWLKEFTEPGFERLLLHNVNPEQEQFIKEFGKHVLPSFR
jgi:coenzyme F420-dependent glucose-6-phosphate dehydrogenase